MSDNLRERRIVMRPSDLGIDAKDAKRDPLSARTIEDLVDWSGGLYVPNSVHVPVAASTT
jgi:malonate decarboxylase alpha subunit